mgnify:CR=1 FL=1
MKLELKENMYYRAYSGCINKITSIKDFNEREYLLNGFYINKDTIKKASYNIIDILEVGDYVNGYYISKIWEKDEITHYVDKTPIKRKEREIVIQAPSYGGIDILKNKNIKSIVTHEQMEQMAYKVGE